MNNQSRTTTRLPHNRSPIHPGEILLEECTVPHELPRQEMAVHLKISRKHLIDIIYGRKPISLEIAQRLVKCFQTSIDFWIQGQMAYGLWHTLQHP